MLGLYSGDCIRFPDLGEDKFKYLLYFIIKKRIIERDSMKKIFLFLFLWILFSFLALSFIIAQNEPEERFKASDEQANDDSTTTSEGGTDDVLLGGMEQTEPEKISEENPEFNIEPGITPDNPLYFIDDLAEKVSIGNDPEKALAYREEKIAEAKAMVEEGKPEEAEKVLDTALNYGEVLEKEVSPEIKRKVEESSEKMQYVLEGLREESNKNNWEKVGEGLDKNIEKEKKIATATELVFKINELCETLAKIDPLQYSDNCRAKGSSPNWMKEKDKELTKEQENEAKIFFEKLSECFESPENCNCEGMGIQKFEDFCLEKSKLGAECKKGDKDACDDFQSGGDPSDMLPNYLVPILKKAESKYMKAEFGIYMPDECEKEGARTLEECNKIMFKLNSPGECLDARLDGESKEDEIKCKRIMFEKNTPEECIKAGITKDDKDAPRKCAKLMFSKRAPRACIDAGITGEGRDDEAKCRELMFSEGEESGKKNVSEGQQSRYKPKFNRDCNSIKDSDEKIKCYEEFYNNAQVQVRDDFREREFKRGAPKGREFAASMGAANPDRPCPDGFCDKWEIEHPNDCPQDCGGSSCQSSAQIENLRQECKNKGQDAVVEKRGGCPWVICIGGDQEREGIQNERKESSSGQKCPDRICDEYERMNPYACPEDCGGQRIEGRREENRVDQPQQPEQQGQFCSGQAPNCASDGAPFCQNGNWICPQPQAPQQEQQPLQPQASLESVPQKEQSQVQQPEQQVQEPSQETVQQPETAPVTGGVIDVDNSITFWDYWFNV